MDTFIIHGCEQVLRFTRVENWDDLSEERKVQLGFNLGVIALGLKLNKQQGFQALNDVRQGKISMKEFNQHLKSIIEYHGVEVNSDNIMRPV